MGDPGGGDDRSRLKSWHIITGAIVICAAGAALLEYLGIGPIVRLW